MVRMNRVKMPVLWFPWPQDEYFPLDCQAVCYRAAPGPHLVSLVPGMRHGHEAGWNPPDSYGFAESIVREGRPWCRQTGAQSADGMGRVEFSSARPLDRALLVSTSGTGFTGNRSWIESPATIEKRGDTWRVSAPLPAGTTAWFINAHGGDLTVSSDYQETKAQAPRP